MIGEPNGFSRKSVTARIAEALESASTTKGKKKIQLWDEKTDKKMRKVPARSILNKTLVVEPAKIAELIEAMEKGSKEDTKFNRADLKEYYSNRRCL